MQSVSTADCLLLPERLHIKELGGEEERGMAVRCESREGSLDGDEDEAVEIFGLRLIVPDHWEAVSDDGVDLSLAQLQMTGRVGCCTLWIILQKRFTA